MKVKDHFIGNLEMDEMQFDMIEFVKNVQYDFINDNHLSSRYGEILGIKHKVDPTTQNDRFFLGWYGIDGAGQKMFTSVIGFDSLINAQKALKIHTDRGDFFGERLKQIARWGWWISINSECLLNNTSKSISMPRPMKKDKVLYGILIVTRLSWL